MQIYGPAHLHGPQQIGPPHAARASRPETPGQAGPIRDELDISEAARAADQADQAAPVRQELVDQLRARIAAGTYETPEKLDVALDRLLDEIG
jgi:negative regulator of flagellin synthesis FlgM